MSSESMRNDPVPEARSSASAARLAAFGWRTGRRGAAPTSSVEVVASGTWAVARLWSSPCVLTSSPLPPRSIRVVVGVQGEAEVVAGGVGSALRAGQMMVSAGDTPLSTDSSGLWARCEWRLPWRAAQHERFAPHFDRPLPLPVANHALLTSTTNALCGHPALGRSPSAGMLADVLSLIVQSAIVDATGEAMAFTTGQQALFRRAMSVIESRYADSAFDATALAAALHVSSRYLRTVFAVAHTTPRMAIEARRVRAAWTLLGSDDASHGGALTAVARDAGFSTVARMQAALRRSDAPGGRPA
ncbi:helix-turn-helix domain-containing protein [Microbacterium sp. No. 7]|uniref:helix-turn-helix domain-containing protein n=1 Tax=Microbacterium sp. No. 7 TaxID=1714373 RepID=UPI0006CFBD0F|nr:helix-turn-helix domain-containing protein [Microbacterium sp. No. 7]